MLRKVQLFWPLIKHPRPARKQIQFSFFYRCFFFISKGIGWKYSLFDIYTPFQWVSVSETVSGQRGGA